jgi:hypothetical protein
MHNLLSPGRKLIGPMHTEEITPARFASAVAAVDATLGTLSGQADRAELLATLTRTIEVWVLENPDSSAQPSEPEVLQSLSAATRSYWRATIQGGR